MGILDKPIAEAAAAAQATAGAVIPLAEAAAERIIDRAIQGIGDVIQKENAALREDIAELLDRFDALLGLIERIGHLSVQLSIPTAKSPSHPPE